MLYTWRALIWFNRFPHGYDVYESLEEDPDDAMDAWEDDGKIFIQRSVYLFI